MLGEQQDTVPEMMKILETILFHCSLEKKPEPVVHNYEKAIDEIRQGHCKSLTPSKSKREIFEKK